jgi:hypothetical protein
MKELMKKIIGWVKCRFGYHDLVYTPKKGYAGGNRTPRHCVRKGCNYKWHGLKYPSPPHCIEWPDQEETNLENGVSGLMPGISHSFMSRDYGYRLYCKNNQCYLYASGECASPAAVEITDTGKCKLWDDFQKKVVGK